MEADETVTTTKISNQSDFRNKTNKTVKYKYGNKSGNNGNLTKYFNKRSDNITYNSLNLPISLAIGENGNAYD